MATNTKTLLTVKIDKKLKERAKQTAASFGLPLGTMVNSLIRGTVETGRLELLTPKAIIAREIREAVDAYENGEVSPSFKNTRDLRKWLEA